MKSTPLLATSTVTTDGGMTGVVHCTAVADNHSAGVTTVAGSAAGDAAVPTGTRATGNVVRNLHDSASDATKCTP